MRFGWVNPLLLGLCGLVAQTAAKATSITTQSVEYCGEAQIVLVERFAVSFFPGNNTLTFEATANTINNSVEASINAELTAYSLTPFNITIDLCDIASGVLCPIPQYNFVGGTTFFVPDSLTNQIPGIAFVIPDLEATVTVRITDINTNTEAACLFVRLSNGLTTEHDYVTWAVSGIVILGFLYSVLHYLFPLEAKFTAPDYRLMTFITWLQFIVSTGVVSVEYPAVFTAFTRNFGPFWGLLYIQPIQDSLAHTVSQSGGSDRSPQSATEVAGTLRDLLVGLGDALGQLAGGNSQVQSNGAVNVPEVAESSPIPHEGIDQFVQHQGIDTGTAFATALINFLLVGAMLLVIIFIVSLLLVLRDRTTDRRVEDAERPPLRTEIISFAVSIGLKLFRVALFPLVTLGAFQFRFADETGWALLVVTGIFWTIIILLMFYLAWRIRRKLVRHDYNTKELSRRADFQQRYGPIFPAYKQGRDWYTGFQLALIVLRGVFIGAFQDIPLGQLIPLLIIEVASFVVLCIFRPYQSKWSNLLDGFLALARVVCVAILFTFLTSVNLNRIAVTVLGIVILVIQSVIVIILFIVLVVQILRTLVWLCCRRRGKPGKSRSASRAKRDAIMQDDSEKRRHQSNGDTESSRPLSNNSSRQTSNSDSMDSALRGPPRMSQRQGSRLNVASAYA